MIRILYAGYLAFALCLIYPMVQSTVMASTACLRSALPGNTPIARSLSASDVGGADCVRAEVVAGRRAVVH
ncbi:hypothetical protein WT56_20640 [Burkholderia pseudomultivorans]|uniref:Uncharacterized protein n=1 Tax=Burkholderia pseudomultivorans TaxID=1207504 RepID=A0A132EDK9_9BURK|nr:hypothetical protein [Burkholderia pseudomultivorans]KWF26029.1 hypothetical protein WT56_20640 [Burkholderia pseudomultivorans]